jgi:hypothetical protein
MRSPALAFSVHDPLPMRITGLIVALVVASGCGVEAPPPPTAIDAPDGELDGATLPACTGAAYDPCTDNTQCMSQNCRVFNSDGIQICTATCDAANPCPDFNGAPVACNMNNRCNPRGMNACMR